MSKFKKRLFAVENALFWGTVVGLATMAFGVAVVYGAVLDAKDSVSAALRKRHK